MKKIKYSDKNFTSKLLPATRKEQFKDLFKNEWKTIFSIGFLLLVFAIPYIGLYGFRYVVSSFYMSALKDGGASEETIGFNFIIFRLIFDAGNIIPYSIFAIGLSGCSRIFSNLIYGEGILFKEDFNLGVKKYWKTYLVGAIAFTVFKLMFRLITGLLQYLNSTGFSIIYGVAIIAMYLFIVPVIMYMVVLNTRYNITFRNNFRTASSFTLMTIIPVGIFTILLFFVLYLPLIAQLFVIILVIGIITMFIVPIYILLWRLYIAHVFDKHINQQQYPDFYRKGLSK